MLPSVTPLENRTLKARTQRVQFGAKASGGGGLTRGLAYMEKQPVLELGFKDVMAFSAPRLALSRNWKEFMDILPLEATNVGTTMLSALALLPVLRFLVSKTAGKSLEQSLGPENAQQYLKQDFAKLVEALPNKARHELPVKLARMGAAFGFLFPFASAFWAAPFFRNWLTLKRTHSANFESIIGFDGVDNKKNTRSQAEEVKYQERMMLKVLATGFGAGLTVLFGFSALARKMAKDNAGKLLEPLRNHLNSKRFDTAFQLFDLKGASSNQIKSMPARLIFWAAPAYLGWMHGARSGNEFRERAIQSANGVFWFFFASKLTTPAWKLVYQKSLNSKMLEKAKDIAKTVATENREKADDPLKTLISMSYAKLGEKFEKHPELLTRLRRLRNWKSVLNDYGVPIGSLSAVQFINFTLTEKKIREAQAGKSPKPAATPLAAQPGFSAVNAPANTAVLPSTWQPVANPFSPQAMTPPQNSYAGAGWFAQPQPQQLSGQ